jgi:predicted SAM-dependent methyltransferase
VEAVVGNVTELEFLQDGSVDFAFASNLFEHVTQADFATVLGLLRRKLSAKGELAILQPNYRYVGAAYYDFIDHRLVISTNRA